jgi:putative DNA primase/helicase
MLRATDVAFRLDLKRHPNSWRGRCPCCEYAANTFSVRASESGWARLFCSNGCTADELAEAVARAAGQPRPVQQPDVDTVAARERKRVRALALWRGSEPAVGTLADHYLATRGLPELATSPVLRFRGDTPHPERGRLPALVALVTDVAGAPISIHRTFLARDGTKARIEPAKASLGPFWGGAIRLQPVAADVPLVIGEGIESSASAGHLMGFPAWAAISAGNLAKGLILPPEARHVVIAADPDEAGQRAARDAWLRWRAEGRNVQIATPDAAGDFNDLLRAREAGNG